MRERFIRGRMSECEQLFDAIGKGAIGQMDKLLSRDVSTDCRDQKGKTPLMKASAAGKPAMAVVLLRNKANVNAVDDDGNTALMEAAHGGHLDVIKLLMSHGADASGRNNEGLTALDIAQKSGHHEVAAFLSAQSAGSTLTPKEVTSTDPDDDGPTTDGPAGAAGSVPVAAAMIPLSEPQSYVQELDLEALPSVAESPYFKAQQEPDMTTEDRKQEAEAHPNPVVEAPEGSGNDQKASVETTHTNPIETILTFVMSMVMPGVANPRLLYDLLCQGALERFRGRTINEAAQDIQIIVFSAVSNILMFLGYYLLVVFFDKDPAKAFSRNPKKQTSLNELAQQKGMPFTRQRLSECVRCAALDMALRRMGLHLDSLTYYHYAEISKLPKLQDQIALAQLVELQRLTAGEVKERVGKQLGKISSEDKRIAKAVMRNVGDILRMLTDEETQDFLKDKERMKAAFEPTESTALLGNIRKLKKKIPVTEALFTDLEPSLLDLLREYTHQDEGVDVEVEEDSE